MRKNKIKAGELLPEELKPSAKKRYLLLILNELTCLTMLVSALIFFGDFPLYAQIVICVILAADIFFTAFLFFKNSEALFKLLFTINIFAVIIVAAYIIMDAYGLFEDFSNVELIKNFILSTSAWGKVVFILLTVFQTVVLPIPAFVVSLVGTALYGPMQSFIYTTVGIIAGSVICFYLGRLFGTKLVNWIAGAEETAKYREIINTKGRFIFIIMMIMPFFPDDLICMVVGLSAMSFGYFFIVILLTRPVMLAIYSFLGTGEIIPFSGWGLWVWLAIFVITVVGCTLIAKYQDKVVEFFNRKLKRRNARGFDSKNKKEL